MTKITFAFSSLLFLWAYGGGQFDLFWSRQVVLGIALCLWGLAIFYQTGELSKTMLWKRIPSMGKGISIALAGAAAVLVLCLAAKTAILQNTFPWLEQALVNLKSPSYLTIFLMALLVAPGKEFVYRGILQPEWGLSGVCFLDAITIGFGAQSFLLFLGSWAMGFAFGRLKEQHSIQLAVLSHGLWTLLSLLIIKIVV